MHDSKPVNTAMETGVDMTAGKKVLLHIPRSQAIGYNKNLFVCSRPDILFAVS